MAIQYIKRKSFLHDLDARTKLLIFACTTAITMIVEEPLILVLLFAVLYYMGRQAVEKDTFNKNLKALVTIFLMFGIFQTVFANPEGAHHLFYLIPGRNLIPVTVEGIFTGITVFFRLFCVILAMQIMLYTTPPVEMALTITERGQKRKFWATAGIILLMGSFIFLALRPMLTNNSLLLNIGSSALRVGALAMVSLAAAFVVVQVLGRGLPSEMGVALMLGFATVNILFTQTKQITNAQKARGYDVQPKNLIDRVKEWQSRYLEIFPV